MKVKALRIYPIKSCGAIEVEEALVTKFGLAIVSDPRIFDRRWMIVRDGRHLSQRVFPRMALIRPSIVENGLLLRAPKMNDLFVRLDPLPTEVLSCYCWDEPIFGLRYDEKYSQWFRTFLESDDQIDFVIFDDQQFQGRSCQKSSIPTDAHPTDVAIYHDMCPIHLCSVESVNDLNTRLKHNVSICNFRPNIIVEQTGKSYCEDHWRELRIGQVTLRWISPCLRCLLPTVDQQTGIKDPDQEPWKTLRTYRLKSDLYGSKVLFGIYLTQCNQLEMNSGVIHQNDPIEIIAEDREFWLRKHSNTDQKENQQ